MNLIKGVAIALGTIVVLVLLVVLGARLGDGPLGPLPGGPLETGDFVERLPTDLPSDLHQTVELQVGDRSRTVGLMMIEGRLHITSIPGTPPGKTWNEEALLQPASVIRMGGFRHRVTLVRVEDAARLKILRGHLERVFADEGPGPEARAKVWFFEVHDRA